MPGLTQVYTGNGKGKTTAALGLLLRAVGAGHRVFLCQFLKDGKSGECAVLHDRFPEVVCRYFGRGVWVRGEPSPEDTAAAIAGFSELCQAVTGGSYNLVIADEILHAVNQGMISAQLLADLIDNRPEGVELVLTGRDAHPLVLERSELITEMCSRRHPFDCGIAARPGIEF